MRLAEESVKRAMELMNKARATGLFKLANFREGLATDPDLAPLRRRRVQEIPGRAQEGRRSRFVAAALTELTGMDRSVLSKLETGPRANPTVETLLRYAEAVGKRLVVSLADA